ncbi:hypothetical protein EVAR_12766_1 [Eumeta japonica]|uniref:Uncharacterized protein n=1 Tax=Eumeta variegata TaxID=151549 RepID=A0A4C1UC06_EUMVA|nr:hypothetical protein EVAR_12766_1 [Eumeta japonica]
MALEKKSIAHSRIESVLIDALSRGSETTLALVDSGRASAAPGVATAIKIISYDRLAALEQESFQQPNPRTRSGRQIIYVWLR